MTDDERLFSAYMRQRRFAYEYEAEVGGRRPDFCVDHKGERVYCEVFSPTIRLPNKAGSFDAYGPLRTPYKGRKAKQMKAAGSADHPYVLVLGRENSDIPFGADEVMGSMYGNLGVVFSVSVDPSAPPPLPDHHMTFLGGGRLQAERNRDMSAVVIVSRFNPTLWRVQKAYGDRLRDGRASGATTTQVIRQTFDHFAATGDFDEAARLARVQVFHNRFARRPLSFGLFDGPHDDQWAAVWHDDGTGTYDLVAQGVRRWEVPV